MSVLTKPYCTVLDVQSETKNSEPENEPIYIDCINLASRYVDEKCRRDFWYTNAKVTAYRVSRPLIVGRDILLPFPIIDLLEVRLEQDPTVVPSHQSALSEIEYYFEKGRSTINISSTVEMPYPFQGRIDLLGEFGYTLATSGGTQVLTAPPTNLPSAIRRATTIVAAAWSNNRRVENVALDGSKSLILDNTVSKEVDMLLNQWVFRVKNNF